MPTLSSLVELEVVIMRTSGVASDNKVGIMTTPGFQCTHVIFVGLTILQI